MVVARTGSWASLGGLGGSPECACLRLRRRSSHLFLDLASCLLSIASKLLRPLCVFLFLSMEHAGDHPWVFRSPPRDRPPRLTRHTSDGALEFVSLEPDVSSSVRAVCVVGGGWFAVVLCCWLVVVRLCCRGEGAALLPPISGARALPLISLHATDRVALPLQSASCVNVASKLFSLVWWFVVLVVLVVWCEFPLVVVAALGVAVFCACSKLQSWFRHRCFAAESAGFCWFLS